MENSHPDKRRYTWRQKTPIIQCRLDFWLITDTLQDVVEKSDIIPSVRSDHSAVIMTLRSIKENRRGANYWKLNNSLLLDKNYVTLIEQNIENWVDSNIEDKRVVWEMIKYNIRKTTIDYSKIKRKETDNLEVQLHNDLQRLDKEIALDPKDKYIQEKEDISNQIRNIENDRIKGAAIRSKIKWFEEGEKSSKFFFSQERNNGIRSHMRKLKNIDGKIICDAKEILAMQKNFYKKLYSSKTIDLTDKHFVNSMFKAQKTLNLEEQHSCEGQITAEECEDVLKMLGSNKSPGNDGLTYEFYKTFWPIISKHYVDSLNYSFQKGELSNSQKQAVIKLLEKKDKDRSLIQRSSIRIFQTRARCQTRRPTFSLPVYYSYGVINTSNQ